MPQVAFYRYISQAEVDNIRQNGFVQSLSGITYFTPDFYDNAGEAHQKLALPGPYPPGYRIGPIPGDEMPDFDAVRLTVVPFKDPARPGGGVQGATTKRVYLSSLYHFASGTPQPFFR